MGKASRDKGARREREIVTKVRDIGVDAEKVSGMYWSGHDIEVYLSGGANYPMRCEVKARANGGGFTIIERWLGDNDGLFLVRDRKPPLVVSPWAVWAEWAQVVRAGDV